MTKNCSNYKKSVLTPHRILCFLSSETNCLILLQEPIAAYCEIYIAYSILRARDKLLEC